MATYIKRINPKFKDLHNEKWDDGFESWNLTAEILQEALIFSRPRI